ncbi:MAG: fibronectin type III domain-containing protein [Salinispira sp.]
MLVVISFVLAALLAGCPEPVQGPTVSQPGTMAAPTLDVGNTQLRANWIPPEDNGGSAITAYELRHSDDGGSPITSYDVQYKVSTAASWTMVTDTISGTSYTIPSLVSGTSYDVRVRAVNAIGTGDWSAPATETARIIGTRAPFGTAASVILSAAINTQIADESLTVTVATATTPVAGVTGFIILLTI